MNVKKKIFLELCTDLTQRQMPDAPGEDLWHNSFFSFFLFFFYQAVVMLRKIIRGSANALSD